MGLIYDGLLNFLRQDEWPIHEIGDGITISTAFEGQDERWACVAQAVEEADIVLFYSTLPIEVPATRRDEMAKFLCYLSYTVPTGCFEISREDGDVRFKTSLSVLGLPESALKNEILPQLIKNVVYNNVLTMEAHIDAVQAVINGEDPVQVLEALSA